MYSCTMNTLQGGNESSKIILDDAGVLKKQARIQGNVLCLNIQTWNKKKLTQITLNKNSLCTLVSELWRLG